MRASGSSDTQLLSQPPNPLGEIQIVAGSVKLNRTTSFPAAKALERPVGDLHKEAGVLFLMQRTQTLQLRTAVAGIQLRVAGVKGPKVESLNDPVLQDSHGNQGTGLGGSENNESR